MTIQEAKDSIGKPFKYRLIDRWDVIVSVDEKNGFVQGEFVEAPVEDCRLKQAVPPQFQKPIEIIE
jgi:hypothetical protein